MSDVIDDIITAEVTFSITNTGDADLTINSIGATGDPEFTVGGTTSGTLTPTDPPMEFTVTFNPTDIGTKSATITIDNTDADEGTFTFDVSGLGIDIYTTGYQDETLTVGDVSVGRVWNNTTDIINLSYMNDTDAEGARAFDVFVVSPTEIYAVGYDRYDAITDTYDDFPVLWKWDGSTSTDIAFLDPNSGDDEATLWGVTVTNDNIFVVGETTYPAVGEDQGKMWIVPTSSFDIGSATLVDITDGSADADLRGITHDSSGNIYIAGNQKGAEDIAYYWKVEDPSGTPVITEYQLGDGITDSYGDEIMVVNGTVYISGSETDSSDDDYNAYWTNPASATDTSAVTKVTFGSPGATAALWIPLDISMDVIDNGGGEDVYVTGTYENTSGNDVIAYWVDYGADGTDIQEHIIYDPGSDNLYCSPKGIFVHGNDVYLTGHYDNIYGQYVGYLWKHNIATDAIIEEPLTDEDELDHSVVLTNWFVRK